MTRGADSTFPRRTVTEMLSFTEWMARAGLIARPWLVLGKGPSFAARRSFDLSRYATLGLNHVCCVQPVDVAHVVDLDVVEQAGDALEANAGVVVLPWFPHVRTSGGALGTTPVTRPSSRSLSELVATVPALGRLARTGRLLWYNASTARTVQPGCPVIRTEYFSAVPALDLLAVSGVRVVRSLGVDGGDRYSPEFRALEGPTLLTGMWKAFDPQFTAIAQIRLDRGVSFAPLDIDAPVRVYVGATRAQELPRKVLAFSIDASAPSMARRAWPRGCHR